MSYFVLGSAGMTGALIGSVAYSFNKGHGLKLMGMRIVENIILGWGVYSLANYISPDLGYGTVVAITALGIYFMWTNPMVRPIADKLDALGSSVIGAAY